MALDEYVLPALAPVAPEPKPPRYLTVTRPNGLKAVVRADGTPVVAVPPPPAPALLRLFTPEYRDDLQRRREAQERKGRRRDLPPPDPAAPVFAPDALKAARTELRCSQRDLAPAIGASRGHYALCESGKRALTPVQARRLAALLAAYRTRTGAAHA